MNDVLETFVDWKAFEYKYSNNPGMDKERVKKEKQVSKTQEKQEEWVMTKLMEKFIQNMALTESVFELLELAYRTLEKEIDNE